MTPNISLMLDVLDHIDANPERWNQAEWVMETGCGTAYCFAGWAVRLAVGPMRLAELWNRTGIRDGSSFGETAGEMLGISPTQRENLFESDNNREDLGLIVRDIAADAGVDLPFEAVMPS